jgi:pimeloyl-ACP methyl ester carboxylesterase
MDMSAARHRVGLGEVTLAVTEAATGPPLVLLHGIGSSAQSWLPVQPALAARFRIIAPDQRGHGDSDKPESGYRISDFARDLDALLDHYHLERPLILGHSLGALVALSWAASQPARANALLLEDPPLTPPAPDNSLFDDWIALASSPVDIVAAHYRNEHPDWTEEECRRRAEVLTSTALSVFTELRAERTAQRARDVGPALMAITSPVLVLRGEVDRGSMLAPEDAVRFQEIVPNAHVRQIAGAGHGLHREQPERFVAEIFDFLDAHSTQR